MQRTCEWCKAIFDRPPSWKARYCSMGCYAQARFGPDRKFHPEGYVLIRKPDHPRPLNGDFIYEHIFVMENMIGRYLIPPEEVHHVNEIRSDNRPENLILCPDRKFHKMLHIAMRIIAAGGNPDTQRLCCKCGLREKSDFSNDAKGYCRSCHSTYENNRRKHAHC